MDEEKITVSQNEKSLPMPWKDVIEVMETRCNITVYLSKVRALVLPKEDIGSQLPEVKDLIRRSVQHGKVRLKKEEK